MPGRTAWRATLLVGLAACGFGSISTLTVIAQRHGVGLAPAMAFRYASAAPLLAIVAGLPALRAASMRHALALIVLGGLGQVAVSAISLSALAWLDVATLGFLFYTFPAWVMLISAARGVERLDARRMTALGLALVGIALVVGRPGALPTAGVVRALGAALIYAAYIPMLHWLRGALTAAATSAYVVAGAALAFVLGAAMRGQLVVAGDAAAWGAVVVLSLVCTVVTFIAFLNGLAVLGPVRTAIISTVEPFWTSVLGALVLGQGVGLSTLGGGALIAAAVLLLQRRVASR